MATINTIQDLLRLLDENPEWVDALRARLLTQEILEMPERLARLEATVERLVETTNQFIESTNKRFDALEAGQTRHESELKALRSDIGVLRGGHARATAIRKSAGIARGMGLRRTRNLSMDDLYDVMDLADTSDIHANLLTSFANADLVMEAADSDGETCYVALEVSYTVHDRDISRAARNSRFLTRFTGRPAFAAVSGESLDDDVQDIIDSGEVFWYQLTSEDLEVD